MRILYIHQYFKTPEEGGPIRSFYLATAMAQAGHEVVLLTSHNKPGYEIRQLAGIEVHYLPVYYSNELGPMARSKAFLNFLKQAGKLLRKLAPNSICYVSSTPLTVGLLALYMRYRLRVPYVFEVRDLWPEAPVQLGYIRNRMLKMGLQKLEKILYRQARAVVALSPGIARGVQQRQPKARVVMVPNMADCRFFQPAPKDFSAAKHLKLHESFVVSYLGAAGPANQLEYLLQAAHACQQEQLPVKFLLAAAGGRLEALKAEAKKLELENLLFLPYGSKQQVKGWLSISDAVYTSFGPYPVLETNSPNKFFDGLAAGKLSIVNTRGWLKELVEEHRCGFYAPPEKPQEFVRQLKPFLENKALLQEYQQNARQLAEQEFDRDLLSNKIIRLLEEAARKV